MTWMLRSQGSASSDPGICLRCKRADKSALGTLKRPLRPSFPAYFVNVHERPLRAVQAFGLLASL